MSLSEDIISEFERRVCGESIPRIIKCLDMLNEDQLWYKANDSVNSIANLILHLEGNARQWIISTFEAIPDERVRHKEFEADGSHNKEELRQKLLILKDELKECVGKLNGDDLELVYDVQVYREKGISIIIHVIEHFSYHTGQIAYLTKLLADKDLDFYSEALE